MASNLQNSKAAEAVFAVKNIVICFLLTVAILFITACISVVFNSSDTVVALTVGVVTYFCVGICGFRYARRLGRNGLVSGALSGLIYVIVLYLIGCAVSASFIFNTSVVLTVTICIVCGAIGGIIGVNAGPKRKK